MRARSRYTRVRRKKTAWRRKIQASSGGRARRYLVLDVARVLAHVATTREGEAGDRPAVHAHPPREPYIAQAWAPETLPYPSPWTCIVSALGGQGCKGAAITKIKPDVMPSLHSGYVRVAFRRTFSIGAWRHTPCNAALEGIEHPLTICLAALRSASKRIRDSRFNPRPRHKGNLHG